MRGVHVGERRGETPDSSLAQKQDHQVAGNVDSDPSPPLITSSGKVPRSAVPHFPPLQRAAGDNASEGWCEN